jgi:glycosyltransferase involved in cell wall biosynthesis
MSVMLLAAHLDPSEFEPVILLHQPGGPLQTELEGRDLEWTAAPPALSGTGHAALASQLPARARFLRQAAIDIVHSNEGLMHVMWGPAARLAGVPSVWHHRGHPSARGLRWLAPLTADRLIAVSRFAAPPEGLWSAADRTAIIHSPFETGPALAEAQAAAPAIRAGLDLPQECLLLGFFGHLADRKRPLMFVHAVAAARRNLGSRPVVGLMFGDTLEPGLDAAVDAEIARLGLEGQVRRMGFCRPIEPWIAAVDANVVPAVDEPFGRTLIEAMLLGTPVVAAMSGGNIEALIDGETGLLTPPDDPNAMGAAIAQLADTSFAARLAAAAKDDALQRFGIERHVTAVTNVYRSLLRP